MEEYPNIRLNDSSSRRNCTEEVKVTPAQCTANSHVKSVVGRQELYVTEKQHTWWFYFGHSGFLAGSSVASLLVLNVGNFFFYAPLLVLCFTHTLLLVV